MHFLKLILTTCIIAITAYIPSVFASPKPISYGVYNITEQRFLDEHHSNHVRPIASLTKLMTAYIFIKNMPVTCYVSLGEQDIDLIKYTSSKLPKNEQITCLKLLNAMLVSSDNMATFALSRSLPEKSRADFIYLMNKQAREWKMNRTFFVDPAGLDPRNVSTVSDLSILISHIIKEPLINIISGKDKTLIVKENGSLMYLNNTNRLVREMGYKSSISKTGYINESGYNLIFSPQKLCNQSQLAFIFLGSTSSINRSNFAVEQLDIYHCANSKVSQNNNVLPQKTTSKNNHIAKTNKNKKVVKTFQPVRKAQLNNKIQKTAS